MLIEPMQRTELPNHATYLRTRYFGALDGLRCLSIVWVVGFHGKLSTTQLFRRGDYGVDLFFVISGFLITTLLLREKSSRGEISLKNFYARRTLRIFPLYYAAIILYAALVAAMEHGPERGAFFHNIPFYLTYTSNWFVNRFSADRVIFAFSWTLATEEQFYLIWPSILRFSGRKYTPLVWIAIALVIAMVANVLDFTGHLQLGDTGNRIALSIATPICLGCLLAYVFESRIGFARIRPIVGHVISAPLAFIALIVMYVLLIYAPADSTDEALLNIPMNAVLLFLVAACCIREDHLLKWLLANPVVRYIGTISYGMYLLHMLGINATKKIVATHDSKFFAVSLMISIGLASASYWLYERQFLKLKGKFSSRVPNEPVKPELEPKAAPALT